MARRKKSFEDMMDEFIEGLYADGTMAKWENERLEKKAKNAIRKASRKVREAGGNRSVRAA